MIFYLSQTQKAFTSIGIVEDTLVSEDPVAIAQFVGKRTVYQFSQIEQLCNNNEVFAILFRQARIFKKPVGLRKAISHGVLNSAPQTIGTIRSPEAIEWLLNQTFR